MINFNNNGKWNSKIKEVLDKEEEVVMVEENEEEEVEVDLLDAE